MRLNGVKVILEGKFSSSSAYSQLEKQCKQRIERGLSEVAVGVVYDPGKIRTAIHQKKIRDVLSEMPLSVKIWRYGQSEDSDNQKGWNIVTIDGLVTGIRDAVNNVASDDTLAKAVERIVQGVDTMASNLLDL